MVRSVVNIYDAEAVDELVAAERFQLHQLLDNAGIECIYHSSSCSHLPSRWLPVGVLFLVIANPVAHREFRRAYFVPTRRLSLCQLESNHGHTNLT